MVSDTPGQSVNLYSVFVEQMQHVLLNEGPWLRGIRFSENIYTSAQFIMDTYDADHPILRDVLLSQALIDDNVELVSMLLAGEYQYEGNISSSPREDVLKSKPVLPTFAHLLMIQKKQEKPMKEWTEAILRGAPFKRGYVESSFYTRKKEKDYKMRIEWYAKKGLENDRPLHSLFREKAKVEAQELGESLIDDGKEVDMDGSDFDSESEDEADESCHDVEDLDLKLEVVTDDLLCIFKINKMYEHLKLQELMWRCRSLKLWKDHVELVQWFEEQEETRERAKLEEMNKKWGDTKNYIRSRFAVGLEALLKKIDERLKLLESKRDFYVDLRREAVKKARQAQVCKAEGSGGKKRSKSNVTQAKKKAKTAGKEAATHISTTSRVVISKQKAAPLKRIDTLGMKATIDGEEKGSLMRCDDGAVRRRSARLAK